MIIHEVKILMKFVQTASRSRGDNHTHHHQIKVDFQNLVTEHKPERPYVIILSLPRLFLHDSNSDNDNLIHMKSSLMTLLRYEKNICFRSNR